jgi:ABC-2 type transport system permease protein
MMNTTVARLTVRAMLGRRRALLLFILPVVLLGIAVLARALAGAEPDLARDLLGPFAMGTLLPLLALITGTGVIGSEIDDGTIVYVLAKPISRSSIVLAKLAVAIGIVLVFGTLPILLAGLITADQLGGPAYAYTVASVLAGIGYCATFLLLAIVTRHAVVFGLLYAVVWETTIAQTVPGVQAASIQQWSLATTELLVGDHAARAGMDAAVGGIGLPLLAALVVGATWLAVRRLRVLRITGDTT